MALSIDAVPETITREQYLSLIRSVGFEPADIMELRFTTEGIVATVVVRNEAGTLVVDGNEFATHEVFVQVSDVEGGK